MKRWRASWRELLPVAIEGRSSDGAGVAGVDLIRYSSKSYLKAKLETLEKF